jgi:uncharacterized membrane protein
VDWLSIRDRKVKRLADWHARLNVVALIVFATDFYLRTTSGARWIGDSLTIPMALSVFGLILISISGWVGGEMVYVHGVAVKERRDSATSQEVKREPENGIRTRAASGR